MISELESAGAIFLFLSAHSKLIRKPCLELMIWMISELEGSGAYICVSDHALKTHQKAIPRAYDINGL